MAKRLKRNITPCSCGSGKKFKKCCGRRQGARESSDVVSRRLQEMNHGNRTLDEREHDAEN